MTFWRKVLCGIGFHRTAWKYDGSLLCAGSAKKLCGGKPMTQPKPDEAQPGTDKWKGVERLAKEVCYAVFDNESDEPSVDVAAAKLRERLEPLLEAAQAVIDADLSADIQNAEKLLQERLATWR